MLTPTIPTSRLAEWLFLHVIDADEALPEKDFKTAGDLAKFTIECFGYETARRSRTSI